jgi:hypothetical protein
MEVGQHQWPHQIITVPDATTENENELIILLAHHHHDHDHPFE